MLYVKPICICHGIVQSLYNTLCYNTALDITGSGSVCLPYFFPWTVTKEL